MLKDVDPAGYTMKPEFHETFQAGLLCAYFEIQSELISWSLDEDQFDSTYGDVVRGAVDRIHTMMNELKSSSREMFA
jgi:hypothetical protein